MKNFEGHILVVDDDDGIRNLVKKYLNEKNFLINTADCAEEAQKKIELLKFDLIVLDIMMPGKSGLEFLSENRKKFDTPVILLTAKGEAKERVTGLEIGADDYLSKPFEPQELLLRIKNILVKTQKKNEQKETVLMSIVNSIKKVRQESSEEASLPNEDLPRPDVPRDIEEPTLMDALKNTENEEDEEN